MRQIFCLFMLLLSATAASAQVSEREAGRAIAAEERAEESRGLESIGEEAAEVGDDDDAGLGEDDRPAGGMSRVEDEMIEAEDTDGCTGMMGAACPGGDN